MSSEYGPEKIMGNEEASKPLLTGGNNVVILPLQEKIPEAEDTKREGSGDEPMELEKGPSASQLERRPSRELRHPTSYVETLIHTLKGNIGSGMFAMGEAFKHAGLIVGPILTVIIGFICIYNNHVLLRCADFVLTKKKMPNGPSFSDTVETCFQFGPKSFQKWTNAVRRLVKGFVVITQLGFCCVYIVLVSQTMSDVLKYYNFDQDYRIYMLIIYLPVVGSSLITALKFLAPISFGSNICIISAVFLTLYAACQDGLPSPSTRPMVADYASIPIFMGIVIYSFEGIGLILPLQNEMRDRSQFGSPLGVLNVGLTIVTFMLLCVGFIGFLKYGDDVKSSLSLNIPPGQIISIIVQIIFSVGLLLTYPLQFYVAADVVWDDVDRHYGPFKNKARGQMLTRIIISTLTFVISALIPNVGVFISLIGAVCSTGLALIFPALSDIALRYADESPLKTKDHNWRIAMDCITLLLAVVGFVTGTYSSINDLIHPKES